MAGALFLSLRVRAGKGVWSGRGARKACPGHSFVNILSPKDPPKKEARGSLQKWSGGRGSGEGGAGGGAPKKGIEGTGSDADVHEWLQKYALAIVLLNFCPPKAPPKGSSRRLPKVVRGEGVGGGRDRGRRSQEGYRGHRKRFGRVRMATKVCPGCSFVRFAARCLFSRARSRVRRGSQKVARTIGKARF